MRVLTASRSHESGRQRRYHHRNSNRGPGWVRSILFCCAVLNNETCGGDCATVHFWEPYFAYFSAVAKPPRGHTSWCKTDGLGYRWFPRTCVRSKCLLDLVESDKSGGRQEVNTYRTDPHKFCVEVIYFCFLRTRFTPRNLRGANEITPMQRENKRHFWSENLSISARVG